MPEVNQVSNAPFEAGITIKFGAGFDAPWWTPRVHGGSADEVAKGTVALLKAFLDNGGPEALVHVAKKAQGIYAPSSGGNAEPKTFQGGKVQHAAPAAGNPSGDPCPHGRTLREGQGAKGPWAALFCNAPKGSNCDPLWRKPDGSFS
ncbi:hypothetical protein AB0E08_03405 [Streptomyces sp. NPDC048281]|uniref:hypothetical protein n=1 Tax=Streptomyces sp. NPDC048281 TaxID=3154715 RepID=UPI00343969FB